MQLIGASLGAQMDEERESVEWQILQWSQLLTMGNFPSQTIWELGPNGGLNGGFSDGAGVKLIEKSGIKRGDRGIWDGRWDLVHMVKMGRGI